MPSSQDQAGHRRGAARRGLHRLLRGARRGHPPRAARASALRAGGRGRAPILMGIDGSASPACASTPRRLRSRASLVASGTPILSTPAGRHERYAGASPEASAAKSWPTSGNGGSRSDVSHWQDAHHRPQQRHRRHRARLGHASRDRRASSSRSVRARSASSAKTARCASSAPPTSRPTARCTA